MKQFWHIWKHLFTGCPWQCISGRDPKQCCCLGCFLGQYSSRYNKVPMDWQSLFTIMRCCHIKVLFHIFSYYWGKQNCSFIPRTLLYRGLLHRGSTVWAFVINCLQIEKVNIKGKKVIFSSDFVPMAEKPEDLNLPNAVIARLAKDAVSVNF